MRIQSLIDKRIVSATEFRHQLHRIPELAYEEVNTAAAIRNELDRIGVAYTAAIGSAPTATVAIIGDTAKPCVALRADIDALPIVEQTGLAYASMHPGRMHACGHDGHTSMLVGAAAVLKEIANELPVCVKMIWQPAEEGGGGADLLCKAGVLDGRIGPKVSAIFGLHGWPALPLGCVSTRPGPLLAATDAFYVDFIGRGCHAAFPHMGRDPIVTACDAVLNLQQFVSRDLDPTEPAVITIGKINAGTAINVIPDHCRIEGTARTLSDSARKQVQESIRRRCAGIAAADGCSAEVTWEQGYPATINDPKMADYTANIARQAFGDDRFVPAGRPSMGAEDFSYYLERVPGCFFFIGLHSGGAVRSLHSDLFDFSDAAIGAGMRMFVELVRGFGT